MKKYLSTIFVFVILITGHLCGQNTEKLFFSSFPIEETPFLTRKIGFEFYFERNGYKLLSDSLSLKYICNGNKDDLSFSYTQYHMEDPNYKKKITQKYEYYAVALFIYENFNLILFPKENNIKKQLYAFTFSKCGKFIDSLIVNEYRSEQYFDKMSFKHSLIRTNDIVVFNYINLYKPYMRDAENKDEIDKTKVIVNNYKIEGNGKFTFTISDTILLKEKISKFERMNEKIVDDDPLKAYLDSLK